MYRKTKLCSDDWNLTLPSLRSVTHQMKEERKYITGLKGPVVDWITNH